MVVSSSWDRLLKEEYDKDYFKKLVAFVKSEYKNKTIFPKADNIFNALRTTSYEDIKVVILGQDPYHGTGEAHGLSFSVQDGIKIPPSLQNIYKELKDDLGIERTSGSLTDWANQGVLLLNTVLTVEKDKPNSHRNKGWEIFTDKVIEVINQNNTPVVFILWGNPAKAKKSLITNPIHLILESSHPSPFSYTYGFKGSKPFSKANIFLGSKNIKKIDW